MQQSYANKVTNDVIFQALKLGGHKNLLNKDLSSKSLLDNEFTKKDYQRHDLRHKQQFDDIEGLQAEWIKENLSNN